MAFDRKDIALSVGGILASAAVTFLIYRLQANDAAQNASAQEQADAAAAANAAQQNSYLAALPSISIPSTSSDVTNSDATASTSTTAETEDPTLAAIVAAFSSASQAAANATSVSDIIPILSPQTTFAPTSGGVQVPTVNTISLGGTVSLPTGITSQAPSTQAPSTSVVPLVSTNTGGNVGILNTNTNTVQGAL